MDPVGRMWYVKITRGTIGGEVEIGTSHYQSGTQVWYRGTWECPVDPMSEKDVADELYWALMQWAGHKG